MDAAEISYKVVKVMALLPLYMKSLCSTSEHKACLQLTITLNQKISWNSAL